MTKVHKVRREYGESFREVVKGYAEQGNSKTLTAAALGINRRYFYDLLSRFDLHRYFKLQKDQRRECKGGGKGKPKGQPTLSIRKPIEHNGVLWYPGEPMHHYLFSKGGNK